MSLEAHEHDALLPLQPDVLGPLHEAREVALRLDVATEAVVPGSLLKERIPRAQRPFKGFERHRKSFNVIKQLQECKYVSFVCFFYIFEPLFGLLLLVGQRRRGQLLTRLRRLPHG